MKYKFHDIPPEIPKYLDVYYEQATGQREFTKEVAFLASYLGIKQNRIYIHGDHPVGEDVIFIDKKYCGYLDFEFYTFMETGEDSIYWGFEELKEIFK